MFGNKNFVRVRRRTPETIVIQFVLLAGACFICLVGVVAFMHFSSSEGIAATANVPGPNDIPSDTVNVIVPIENIQPGSALEPQMFRYDRRPMVIVGPEIVKEVDETKNLFTKGLLVANQPVNRDLLTSLQPINVLTASIPPGYRALSLPVDAVASVSGWAQPGARVDVVWVYNDQVTKRAAVIASNAKVLSANRQTEHSADDGKPKDEMEVPSTVTLLLPHREALKVRLASKNGQLSLVLRGTVDPGTMHATTGAFLPIDLYNGKNNPEPTQKVLTNVTVKDPKTGATKKMTFDNGIRVD